MDVPQPSGVLIFPPMVESSFGRYFPSLAVLAGYLHSQGIATTQWDLNEEFALHLLRDEHLRSSGHGNPVGLPPCGGASMSAVAGRWLLGNKATLFDDAGRHDFTNPDGGAYLLAALARPYLIDPDSQWLRDRSLLHDDRVAIYRECYARLSLAERIPAGASLIGISVPMGPQLVPALVLADMVREVRPDVRIVLGGPTLSLLDEDDLTTLLLAHDQVDAIVRFDGELPLAALLRQAAPGASWRPETVAGVSAVTGGGVMHVPPGPGLHPNVLPHAHYDGELMGRLARPEIGIVQARGCYWGKCDYCDFVELYDGSPPYRGRSVGTFLGELEYQIATHGVRYFEFITESIPPAFARRLCSAIVEQGIDISWNSFAMVDRRFDRDTLRAIAESGCDYLVIGMETTNTRVLQLVHKSADREENLRFMRTAQEVGLRLHINLIPDLPSTTYAESMASLDDIGRIADCVASFSVYPFEATRSSQVGRTPERFGLLVSSHADGADQQAQFAVNHLRNVDPAMTPDERRAVHLAYQDFAVRHATRARAGGAPALPGPDDVVSVAVGEIDVWREPEATTITNVGQRERIVLTPAVVAVVDPLLTGATFTFRQLAELHGRSVATLLLRELSEALLLHATPAPTGSVPSHDSRMDVR
ncbi:radical SAM protein [Dactylosporangium sp. NPDC005555]|uniref:B12-binding domain-containing radical SAM protein n=1 Tax=Dactylosporangium sp. NPDC005555 TaxID=3154889 RepID=UPI0033A3BE42